MLVSMTGFGRGIYRDEHRSVAVEIRTLNHRFTDIVVRLPPGYLVLEDRIRRHVGAHVARGRAEISVAMEEFVGRKRTVKLDRGLLEGFIRAWREAESVLQQEIMLGPDTLVNVPGLFVVEELQDEPEAIWSSVEPALQDALAELQAMRQKEGERLREDILPRIGRLNEILETMASRAANSFERYRERLVEIVHRHLGSAPIDEQRIAQEIVHFADKSNIDEEVVRAKSHITQFEKACSSRGRIGRRLDFIVQELNREFNTIGAKTQDAQIANLVVEAKVELEKVREQVQNIE